MPKTFNIKTLGGKKTGGSGTSVNPNDSFLLNDPFNPKTLNQQAQTQYNADASLARQNAAMGFPTNDQLGAQAAARGAAGNSVYQDLATRIAGIQQATVAQGNAGSAALGAQNAAASATMPNIAGAPVTGSPIPTGGAQAVLGAQTAAGGNYQGTLQAAALSAGAQANQHALDAGTVAQQDNSNSMQRTLAAALSGIATPTSRATTMLGENQKVDAANKQSLLAIYQGNVAQETTLRSLGYKAAADKLHAQNTVDLANINQGASNYRTDSTNQTRITTTGLTQSGADARSKRAAAAKVRAAKISADAKAKAANGGVRPPTAASQATALKQARALLQGRNKTGMASKIPATYSVQYTAKADANPYATKPTPKTITISAADKASGAWRSMIPAGASVTQAPAPKTFTSKQTGRTGWYNVWNQALNVAITAGVPRTQAVRQLRLYLPAGSVPGVR